MQLSKAHKHAVIHGLAVAKLQEPADALIGKVEDLIRTCWDMHHGALDKKLKATLSPDERAEAFVFGVTAALSFTVDKDGNGRHLRWPEVMGPGVDEKDRPVNSVLIAGRRISKIYGNPCKITIHGALATRAAQHGSSMSVDLSHRLNKEARRLAAEVTAFEKTAADYLAALELVVMPPRSKKALLEALPEASDYLPEPKPRQDVMDPDAVKRLRRMLKEPV